MQIVHTRRSLADVRETSRRFGPKVNSLSTFKSTDILCRIELNSKAAEAAGIIISFPHKEVLSDPVLHTIFMVFLIQLINSNILSIIIPVVTNQNNTMWSILRNSKGGTES